MVRDSRLCATRSSVRLRFGSGRSIHGEHGFLRIMRDYSRSAPQDTTWNSAPSFENPASGSATIVNPETSATSFGPAFTYPYEPSNLNQIMYPVSTQRLIVHRGCWLTLLYYRACSHLGPRQRQHLVGRIFLLLQSRLHANQSHYRRRFRPIITG